MAEPTNQSHTLSLAPSQNPTERGPSWTTTLDVAATISSILWPLVVLVALLAYRHKLSGLLAGVLSRVKKLEIAGISMEWAEVKELTTEWLAPGGGLDLRSSFVGLDVLDSSGRNILTQLDQPMAGDYAVVDLGEGREWLSSRLFILAVLFEELRGLRALVFVNTKDEATKRYIGWIEPRMLARVLALHYPKLEAAYSIARSIIDRPRQVLLPPNTWVTQMGLVTSQAGSDLLKQFLFHLKPKEPAAIPPSEAKDWTPMPGKPGFVEYAAASNQPTAEDEWAEFKGVRHYEYAQWMNRKNLGELLGDSLNTSTVRRDDIRGKSEGGKIRAVLLEEGDFVAVVRGDNHFDRLVNRRALMEATIAANAVDH